MTQQTGLLLQNLADISSGYVPGGHCTAASTGPGQLYVSNS